MTHRTLVESLVRPYALSQRHLLREREFACATSKRRLGSSLGGHLEPLHRGGLLVPSLRVDRPVRQLKSAARRATESWERSAMLHRAPPADAPTLAEEMEAGRVSLGRERSFRPWRNRVRDGGETTFRAYDYLYSPYQLLLVPTIREAEDARVRRRAGIYPADWASHVIARARETSIDNDRVVALLTALEPVYYPDISGHTRLSTHYGPFDEYLAWQREADAVELYEWLGWAEDDLRTLAERLISRAHGLDPLRAWSDLVAQIHPDKLARLEGDALIAIDHKHAAEMILQFLGELAREGIVAPVPERDTRSYHPLDDRLRRRRDRLDAVLSDYDISPHPAVVLVVEGPTEQDLFPKVMRLLGIPVQDSFIRIETLGGIEKQIELLARYLAPSLRRLDDHAAEFLTPPARLVVVVDAEGPFRTSARRETHKAQQVRHVWNALDPEFQTDAALDDLGHMVEVTTWDPRAKDIEYAHFEPRQIARAVIATGYVPDDVTIDDIESAIVSAKTGGSSAKAVWNRWLPHRESKRLVWEQLWPMLERRITNAISSGKVEAIPVCRVLLESYELATRPRRHTVLRI